MVGSSSRLLLRWENLAGTVWLSAGAPGAVSRPFQKTQDSFGGAVSACELGSVVPVWPALVCCAFSCSAFCYGLARFPPCWAAANPTVSKIASVAKLKRKARMASSCDRSHRQRRAGIIGCFPRPPKSMA
jgi:hypothetical protein